MITFFSTSGYDIYHYTYFIGPIIEIIYGHFHPLTLDAQYGSGLTTFLALYYKLLGYVTIGGMQNLLKILTFMQYSLVFFIASAIYQSRKIAFLALLATLFFHFYSQGDLYYTCPGIGFLRFGYIYLILSVWLCEGRWLSELTTLIIVSVLGSLAFIWSFESAVYTLPALFFAEYKNGNIKRFLPVFLICLALIIVAYISPILFQGEWPELWRYYEYPLLYSGGFGQIPLARDFSIWWFFPLLYGFFLIKIIYENITNKLISALTIYGILVFTYYGGEAHPNNLFHVSIPFILLSIYFIINLKMLTIVTKQLLLALIVSVFMSVEMAWDSNTLVAKNIWEKNLPLLKDNLLSLVTHKTSLGCNLYLMSELPKHDDFKYVKSSYIFIEKPPEKVYYMKSSAQIESVKIDDINKFKQGIKKLNLDKQKQISLTEQQIQNLITLNGGHTPTLISRADEKECTFYKPLYPYIEDHSIALLSNDEELYRFYTCTKTHNALGLSSYSEIAINPKAVARVVAKANLLHNKLLLVDEDLIINKDKQFNPDLAPSILKNVHAKKIGELSLGKTTFVIFKNQRV